ncbi:hypothetical protein AK830_g9090 [Neonectria ditissima]|uniref:Uncharacterized protein n=1 Tax=Neonectria ditissima TaxID=78410 RepID=A0A0P7ASH2_9HYPO|nr:hypothetical protein AK830_g9090 [Neonectria ditissima]
MGRKQRNPGSSVADNNVRVPSLDGKPRSTRPSLFTTGVPVATTGRGSSTPHFGNGTGSASCPTLQPSGFGLGQFGNSTERPFQDDPLFMVPPGPYFNPPGTFNGVAVPQPQFQSVSVTGPGSGFAGVSDSLEQLTSATTTNRAQLQQSQWPLSTAQDFFTKEMPWDLDGKVIRINLKGRNGELIYRFAKCCPGRSNSVADIGIAGSEWLDWHPIPPQRRSNQTMEGTRKYFCFLNITDVESIGPVCRRLTVPLDRISGSESGVIVELGYHVMSQLGLIPAVGVSRGKSHLHMPFEMETALLPTYLGHGSRC